MKQVQMMKAQEQQLLQQQQQDDGARKPSKSQRGRKKDGASSGSGSDAAMAAAIEPGPVEGGSPTPLSGAQAEAGAQITQQSFLDGTFAGGWQSNADLPDRRRIIFSIVKVIERMRPDANKMSQK